MKRKPIEILADIINYLNVIAPNTTLNINDISKHTECHYETIREYMALIQFIQQTFPPVSYNGESRSVSLSDYPPSYWQFPFIEQIQLKLFSNRVFDFQSSVLLNSIISTLDPKENAKDNIKDCVKKVIKEEVKENIKDCGKEYAKQYEVLKTSPCSEYIQLIELEDDPNQTRVYLREKGKLKAQGLLALMNKLNGEYIDAEGEIPLKYHGSPTLSQCDGSSEWSSELSSELDPETTPKQSLQKSPKQSLNISPIKSKNYP
jgi:hypothetical protein